jgi:hypothetical protein
VGKEVRVTGFHEEVMSAVQRDLLAELGRVATDLGFYLGGGTAVAIRLGHRRSLDFDWFTARPLGDPMLLAQRLRERGLRFRTVDVAEATLHGEVDRVRVSFLEYRYPDLAAPAEWPVHGLRLGSLEDLACMKLSAVAGRGARKDFVDVYAIGTTRFGLSDMLAMYRTKYGVDDVGHLLMSLVYFDDAESEEMPEMLWDVEWKEITRAIDGWVREQASGTSTR